jgi:hypothetical protein
MSKPDYLALLREIEKTKRTAPGRTDKTDKPPFVSLVSSALRQFQCECSESRSRVRLRLTTQTGNHTKVVWMLGAAGESAEQAIEGAKIRFGERLTEWKRLS